MTTGETTVQFVRRCRHCGEALEPVATFCSKCGASADPTSDKPDSLRDQLISLFGRDLDIERELGRGGMAAVFAAYDPGLQRRVAVKIVLPEIANDRSASDRFLREARTVASLQHPHVVTVYAVKSRDGVHALVMQFVEGRSLDATLAERGSLTLPVAGLVLAHACEGLQHAHDRGVIHRDVKPANVLIEHDGRAIVSDFGIARRDTGPRTTATGMIVGTWAYMSPEQRNAETITPATDQYALGVMAFELLSGRLPFTGSASEMLRGHMYEPPPSLRSIRPNISAEVEAVINRMLEKDPAKRFPSLKEPERVFRTLVQNVGQTTQLLAAYSQVLQSNSQVMTAVAKPVTPSVVARAAAPTVRERADEKPAAARTQAAPSPVVESAPVVAAPASGRGLRGAMIGAGVGVAVLAALFLVMKGGSKPTPTQTGGITAPQGGAGAPPVAAPSGSDAPAPNPDPNRSATGEPRRTTPSGGGSVGGGAILPGALPSGSGESNIATRPTTQLPTTSEAPPVAERKADPAPTTPAAPAIPAATRADAQKLAREFVTMLNQKRFRELGQIPNAGGDAATRAELIRLTETAANFAAGFDRVASTPQMTPQGFETDFDVSLEWRGGSKVMRILLYAIPADGGWKVAGVAISPAG